MKQFHFNSAALALLMVSCLTAGAEILDRPIGVKIGERMTLRPYVSMSLTYDSNPRSEHGGPLVDGGDFFWAISPSLSLDYKAENWAVLLSGYYNYHQYFKNENSYYNNHSYGQDLRWNWSNSAGAEKGWSLILGESFKQITQSDGMSFADGSTYSSDSRQFQISGAVQRRFNEKLHADVNASYYWMNYLDDNSAYKYYGWDRWTVGAEAGYAFSKWTDLILAGAYQGFTQDNADTPQTLDPRFARDLDNYSDGFVLQTGIGSYLTERISYRALVGWSHFSYADGASTDDSPTYTVSGNWKIGETWNTMILASSYYQPSERQYASASRVDAISWGLAKTMVRGKLRATLDLRYRREDQHYVMDSTYDNDYVLNILTGRFGLNYSINRFVSVFWDVEYQKSMNDHEDTRYGAYDYDRFRTTIGVALTY